MHFPGDPGMCCGGGGGVFDSKEVAYLRKCEGIDKRHTAHDEICGRCSRNIGPMTQADGSLNPQGTVLPCYRPCAC